MINLYDFNIEHALNEELIDVIFENDNIRIERIVSMGQTTPDKFIYDQSDDEFVTVVKGSASIYFNEEDKIINLSEGDSLMIDAGRKHQVVFTSKPCIWLCVFYKNS